jgi:hypothetical protein
MSIELPKLGLSMALTAEAAWPGYKTETDVTYVVLSSGLILMYVLSSKRIE